MKYMAEQVKVDAADLAAYDWSGRTIKYHRAQIREAYGFREATRADEDHLAAWLSEEVCPVELSEDRLREALLARCNGQPGASLGPEGPHGCGSGPSPAVRCASRAWAHRQHDAGRYRAGR